MSTMGIGDFTVWSDPESMTTTVSVDGRTEQVTQTVGEMLEILGQYTTRLQDENFKLRKLLARAGRLLPLADWTNVRYDEMASEVMYGIDELGIEVNE